MSYEATGPKGSLIRIEIPGGDLTNAKIINTSTGEELDNVAALKIKADVNSPTAQAEVWLKLVNVDIAIDAYLKDAELLTASFKESIENPEEFEVNGRRYRAFSHLDGPQRDALIAAIKESERRAKAYSPANWDFKLADADPIYRQMVDHTCSCFRCQDARYNEQLATTEEETNDND